jgi:hypothetical protein
MLIPRTFLINILTSQLRLIVSSQGTHPDVVACFHTQWSVLGGPFVTIGVLPHLFNAVGISVRTGWLSLEVLVSFLPKPEYGLYHD